MNVLRGYLIYLAQFLKGIIIYKNERMREFVASLQPIDQYGSAESWYPVPLTCTKRTKH